MADVEYDGFGAEPRQDRRFRPGATYVSQAVSWAGALTSVALIAGLGLWGYRLAVRDVTGVPVIRALEGPARTAPEEPGGELAVHQGLAVNAVAAEGEAEAPADRLTLAPRPVELAETDAPGGNTANLTAPDSSLAIPMPEPANLDPSTTMPDEAARAMALANSVSQGAAPLDEGPDTGVLMPDETGSDPAGLGADLPIEVIADTVPGVARSPRPSARPEADLMALAAVEAAVASLAPGAEAAQAELPAETLPAGTRLVQLGAFDDEATARAEWDKLATRFAALLDGKSRVIQAAESGGRTFFRLRAHGFDDVADARRFCAALMAENAACIPVQLR